MGGRRKERERRIKGEKEKEKKGERKRERGEGGREALKLQQHLLKSLKEGKLLNKVIHYLPFALQTNGNCWFS